MKLIITGKLTKANYTINFLREMTDKETYYEETFYEET